MSARSGRPAVARRPAREGRADASRALVAGRDRRGAITVMAGVFMVVLTMFGGIAVDASRVFSERAQMQTLADAASLAGAIQMQRDSSFTGDTARAYAQRNGLRSAGAEADIFSVSQGVWLVGANAFVDGGSPEDAVRIRLSRRVDFLIAQMFGARGVEISAQSTAWASAPVSRSNQCMKPIVLPYSYMDDVVSPPGSLTADDMRRLRELTEAQRTRTFEWGMMRRHDIDQGNNTRPTLDPGKYYTVNFPGTNGNPAPIVEDAIASCQSVPVGQGDTLNLTRQDDPANQVLQGVRNLCITPLDNGGLGGAFSNGVCTVNGSQVGIPLKVAFADQAFRTGGNSYHALIRMVGSFTVTRVEDQNGDQDEGPDRASSWGALTGFVSMAQDFGPVTNAPSTLRRAVIVE